MIVTTAGWLNVPSTTALALPGLEADNFLAFLALLGLLRALETVQPAWSPRASWGQPPWVAHLHLAEGEERVDEVAVAQAADEGLQVLAQDLAKVQEALAAADRQPSPPVAARRGRGGRTGHAGATTAADAKDVWSANLPPPLYRALAEERSDRAAAAALLAALAGEYPVGRTGYVSVSPLVLTRGQGHQRFLEDLFAVLGATTAAATDGPTAVADRVGHLEAALFRPWRRADPRGGFRWDPEEDRRHALRFRDPSAEGARTQLGATRLAAAGFLSLASAPAGQRLETRGVVRTDTELVYVWPLWSVPLTRSAVEVLLGHPALLTRQPSPARLEPLGVTEVVRAPRIRAGKFSTVGRGAPCFGSPLVSG